MLFRKRSVWGAQFTLVFIVSFMLFGCTAVNNYAKAQQHFNMAAQAENDNKLSLDLNVIRNEAITKPTPVPNPNISMEQMALISNQIQGNYAAALNLITETLNDTGQKKALIQEGLYHSALTLKALSQWKTGLLDEAATTAKEAKKEFERVAAANKQDNEPSMQMLPRDYALSVALPGLIKIDQANMHLFEKRTFNKSDFKDEELVNRLVEGKIIKNIDNNLGLFCFNDSIKDEAQLRKQLNTISEIEVEPVLNVWKKIKKSYEEIYALLYGTTGAKKDFIAARSLLDKKHQLHLYLIMSELAALSNLQTAIENKISNSDTRKEERKKYRKIRDETLSDFKNTLTAQELDKIPGWKEIYDYFNTLLGG